MNVSIILIQIFQSQACAQKYKPKYEPKYPVKPVGKFWKWDQINFKLLHIMVEKPNLLSI